MAPEDEGSRGKRVRVVIIDDHPVFRTGVRSILDRNPSVDIVGEAGSCATALATVEQLQPDIILLDLSLPDCNGLDLTQDFARVSSKSRVVVLSMKTRAETARRAFALGVRGYVTKDSAASHLYKAIMAVMEGQEYVSEDLAPDVHNHDRQADPLEYGYDLLTSREQEVFRLIAEGKTSKQIAARLEITPKTADSHRSNIYRKLQISDPMELVRLAARMNVIEPDRW
ncbi:MAG: DNA-binding response regulator [Spirochaetaceae bacterium]|nr:MAG: DNA-binding response regulator [Spirochaetaceae bacterium]